MNRTERRAPDTVCVAAILKDEDRFVEEWVAYHRLLGVDHFYLYDNDPRQPLADILAPHRGYVTVRAWLIDHDDRRYQGATKQLKAYNHCLKHDAAQYGWVAFLDCDEFISLEKHPDLKTFLAEFAGYDSIAFNWHVFGHNGHYDDPPGLVIESLTRRMKEPRPRTKSVTRPDAIASINSAHRCNLKSGRKCVDANKRRYREELYPGKTHIARVNHYQCRSFENWMRKPERGEAGAFAEDPANAWRFTHEGCLRQFVREIALDRNEYPDSSMSRHVEPVKRYLSDLRSTRGTEGDAWHDQTRTSLAELRANSVAGETNAPNVRTGAVRALDLNGQSGSTLRRVAHHGLLLWRRRLTRAMADAKAASRANDWGEAVLRWRSIVNEFGDRAPAKAFLELCKAYEYQGDLASAEAIALEGRIKHPTDIRLTIKCANIAMAQRRWPEAVAGWRTALRRMDGKSSVRPFLKLSRAYRHQGDLAKAEEILSEGWAIHAHEVRLATEHAKIAMVRQDWPEAILRWHRVLDEFADAAPANAFLKLSKVYEQEDDLDAAEAVVLDGQVKHPTNIPLAVRGAEIAVARKDWHQAARRWPAVLDIHAQADFPLDERLLAQACASLMAVDDHEGVIPLVQDLKRREGESRLLLAVEGVAYLRSSRTQEARVHWTQYWQRANDDQDFVEQAAPAMSNARPNEEFFTALTRKDESDADRMTGSFCIYTALFGDYDDLRSPAFAPSGLKFICFSDRERDVPGWEIRIVDPEFDNPALQNRKIKIRPYDYLKDYDCSLYVDANLVFLADPLMVYQRWLRNESFVAWAHPYRCGVYQEIEAILTGLHHRPAPLLDQYTYFRHHHLPRESGLIEACFLWRDHRDSRVRDLMEQWWDLLVRLGGHRDQPALGYLMWKTGVRPAILPAYLGTSRHNDFSFRLPHLQTPLELEQANYAERLREREGTSDLAKGAPTVRRRDLALRLTWVFRDAFKTAASTVMRGHQLSEIAKACLADSVVNCVDEYRLGEQNNSILILTKGFLKGACVDELAGLKERGNVVCADYVDDPAREELDDCVDVYIASSITQFLHYSNLYSDKLVHLVTHHADPRLKGIRGPEDYCNIGYFGEIENAAYAPQLQGVIDFCLTNTQLLDASWVPRLRHCNVHYAVRKTNSMGVFKPFLKGFTAAQCDSNIIVPRDESDARYYLGSDYPYILKDGSLSSALEMIDYAKESFGAAEWHRGLEIMKSVRQRCDPTQIQSEIRALIARCR